MTAYKGFVKVTTKSYKDWRKATIGNAYDVDKEADYQCYDYANLFWKNATGRWVVSETKDGGRKGGASGIWGARKKNNSGNEFILITDIKQLKKGDIVITNNNVWGHVCFMDQDYSASKYMKVLGQNQGGTHGKLPGAKVKVIDWAFKSYFLGAFRYRKWNDENPSSFFPTKGYWGYGDTSSQIGKISAFMYKTFPSYTKKAALGNYFGKNLKASIKKQKKRTGLEADGNVGPITLKELEKYGFKY